MKTRILIMRPDAPHETREIELPDSSHAESPALYGALKALIEPLVGGPLEHVTVFADFSGGENYGYLDMFVDETGHIRMGPRPVLRNDAATIIYRRRFLLLERDRRQPDDLPWIAGTAVLFEHRVWR